MARQENIVPVESVGQGGAEAVPYEAVRLPDIEPESAAEAAATGPSELWQFWDGQIKAALTHERLFRAEGDAVEKLYFGPQQEVEASGARAALPAISDKTALIHANVDVLKPLLYSETPTPIVTRRWHGDGRRDATDLMAAEAVQRICSYLLDTEDFDGAVMGARDDYLIAGRGIASVVYKESSRLDPTTGAVTVEQQVCPRHREWRRVLFAAGVAWEDAPWMAIEIHMTRGQAAKRFPAAVETMRFDEPGMAYSTKAAEDDERENRASTLTRPDESGATRISPFDTTPVWEIWNREEGKVVWWSPSYTEGILDEEIDPLGLDGFFPAPRPLVASVKGRRLTPRPDIRYYEARADEIDQASRKMKSILKVISVSGLIPASEAATFQKLFTGDNVIIPVQEWIALMSKGNVRDLIQWLPLEPMIAALNALGTMREASRQAMFEASGVSDIMRAQGDPNETATAQQIKGRYAGLRLSSRQRQVALFSLDLLRLMVDVATGQFRTEFIAEICGLDLPLTEADRQAELNRRQQMREAHAEAVQMHQMGSQMAQEKAQAAEATGKPDPDPLDPGPPPEPPVFDGPDPETSWELVHARIKSDLHRKISITIETSSTILADEQADKEARVEFISAFSSFVQSLVPMLGKMVPMKVFKELLLFGIRGFPKSRTLETMISQLPDQDPPQSAPPEDASITVANIKAKVDVLLEQMREAHDLKIKGVEVLQDAADMANDHGQSPEVPEALDKEEQS